MERNAVTGSSDQVAAVRLGEENLPALYHDGDTNSLKAQRSFLKYTWWGLAAVVIAAAAGTVSFELVRVDIGGLVATFAFIVAVYMRVLLFKNRPEKIWYDGRAVAESTKTSAWRYAVGGEPFGAKLTAEEADKKFVQRLRDIPLGLDPDSIIPVPDSPREDITEGMRQLRQMTLPERKSVYQEGRIKEQRDWYSRKAKWNKDRARNWNIALIVIEVIGVGGALVKATNLLEVGLLGFAGALVAAGTSWLQTKQHANLAEAYSVAARELSNINTLLPSCTKESDWADFVGQAEEAISREHTLWIASRTSSRTLSSFYRRSNH